MKDSRGKLWIDLTDMSVWSGHLTGTQRVTYEIGRRFYEQNPQVAFFVYEERSRKFYETSFAEIITIVERSQRHSPLDMSQQPAPSIKGRIKSSALQSYSRLPYEIRKRFTPQRKESIKKVYRRLNDLRKTLRTKKSFLLKATLKTSSPIEFQPADTILILGKPWDTMSFIDTLGRQKIKKNFRVVHLVYDMIPIFLPHVFGKPLPQNYTHYMF